MKRAIKKSSIYAALIILIMAAALLPACGNIGDNEGELQVSYTFNAELYFVNSEYARAGDENLEHFFVDNRECRTESKGNPWLTMLEELKNPPSDLAETAVTADVVFGDVYVDPADDSVMVVDFDSLSSGGSMQEGFLINQIVYTIVKNGGVFADSSNVSKIRFLLKGEKVESLMGHFDSTEPFTIHE
ncbi:hypothetical protein MASR2M70_08270 [Bacillota bacterium]